MNSMFCLSTLSPIIKIVWCVNGLICLSAFSCMDEDGPRAALIIVSQSGEGGVEVSKGIQFADNGSLSS